MTSTAGHTALLEFTGKLTQDADMRQAICDTAGHMKPAVCMRIKTATGRMLSVQQLFDDGSAAEKVAKSLRKGCRVTVQIPVEAITLHAQSANLEVHTCAPAATTPTPTPANEPELAFN